MNDRFKRPNYRQWKSAVDALLEQACGMSYDDLPEHVNIRDFYDDGEPPHVAAGCVLAEQDFYDG